MEVEENGIAIQTELAALDFPFHRREWIIQHGFNHDAAHGVDDQHPLAPGRHKHRGPAAGAACRPVQRADQLRLPFDGHQQLPLVKGVVAKGNDIGARLTQQMIVAFAQAKSMGGVFAVQHDTIRRVALTQYWHMFANRVAARLAHNISKENQAHAINSFSVMTKSSGWSWLLLGTLSISCAA